MPALAEFLFGEAAPGADMPRASRLVVTASVIICLITLNSNAARIDVKIQ